MMRKIKPEDERGVSPVLGVALLIGITVTLVAVVGIVVLGVGPGASAPSAQMDFADLGDADGDTTSDASEIEVSHNGGDSLKADNLVIKVGGNSYTVGDSKISGVSSGSELTAGDSFTVNDVSSSSTVKIIWDNPNTDDTTVIAEYTV